MHHDNIGEIRVAGTQDCPQFRNDCRACSCTESPASLPLATSTPIVPATWMVLPTSTAWL
jgi:hypothetical protein